MSNRQINIHRRGIYILPNLFTLAGLFAAFYGVIAAMEQHFLYAAWAIFISLIFDFLDGRVARLIHAQSAFGAELDSICDMVAFGVVPAVIVLFWAMPTLEVYHLQKIGWIATFIYVACTALRLARFNIPMTTPKKSKLAKRYFFGLPCPAAAAFVASSIGMLHKFGLRDNHAITFLLLSFMVLAAGLMVSNFKYRSFKDIDIRAKIPFMLLLLVLVVLALIFIRPVLCVFVIMLVYMFSGPLAWLMTLRKKGR